MDGSHIVVEVGGKRGPQVRHRDDNVGAVGKVLQLGNQVAAVDGVERPVFLAHRVPRSADLRREIDISTWA